MADRHGKGEQDVGGGSDDRRLTQVIRTTQVSPTCKSAPPEIKRGSGSIAHDSLRSSLSSDAKRKQLEYEAAQARAQIQIEAAQARAQIQMDLINKKLEADLAHAAIEDKGKSFLSKSQSKCERDIGEWIDKSMKLGRDEMKAAVAAEALENPTVSTFAPAISKNDLQLRLLSRMSTPKELPKYSGDPLEWLHFRSSFVESTELGKFTDAENRWRLRSCLQGAAKEAVSALLASGCTAEEVMKALQMTFGRPELIVGHMVKNLQNISPLPTSYQADIGRFATKIRNFVAAMKSINEDDYTRSPNIFQAILAKLPSTLTCKWIDYGFLHLKEGKPKLIVLSDFLEDEAMKISAVGIVAQPEIIKKKLEEEKRPRFQAVLVTEPVEKCGFCKKTSHKLQDCKRFVKISTKSRWTFVKRARICFNCLDAGHDCTSCPSTRCGVNECTLPHHRLLHYNFENKKEPNVEIVANVNEHAPRSLTKIVKIRIHGPLGAEDVYALLDDGSSLSLIEKDLADRIGLHGRPKKLFMRGAWKESATQVMAELVEVVISGASGVKYPVYARKIDQLELPQQDCSTVNPANFPHLHKLTGLTVTESVRPSILIGEDNYHLLAPIEMISGAENEPYGTLCKLGWMIHGNKGPSAQGAASGGGESPYQPMFSITATEHECDVTVELRQLNDLIKNSFAIDSIGIAPTVRIHKDDIRAKEILNETTSRIVDRGERWEVGMPWKEENRFMPDTYPAALSRLKSLERKFHRDPDFEKKYRQQIKNLLDSGYAREVTKQDEDSDHTHIWYLPHFAVKNVNKPEKIRLVMDAAASVNGYCLNDYLLTGPDLLVSLLGVTMRFREKQIALTGDIKEMFLQVRVRSEDMHSQRFLWREDPAKPPKKYVMTSLIFGATSSPFIAQFVKNKNAEDCESQDKTMASASAAIKNNHYMDNWLQSIEDEESAIKLIHDVTEVHLRGGFEMRGWACNNSRVLDGIPTAALAASAVQLQAGANDISERTLGLLWYPAEDKFGFDLSLKKIPTDIIEGERIPTKREMLRATMSIFDVLGFLSPLTIRSKILLQDVWRSGITWDEPLKEEQNKKFREWIRHLKNIINLRIPRLYIDTQCAHSSNWTENDYGAGEVRRGGALPHEKRASSHLSLSPPHPLPRAPGASAAEAASPAACAVTEKRVIRTELHVYSDASEKASSCVAYWRFVQSDGNTNVAFIASKSKVSPLRPMSIPRLELTGALLASRLAATIEKEHTFKPDRRIFWTDSTTVLRWIRSDPRQFKMFVAYRLGEIDELTDVSEWRYVPTKLNAADIATRDDAEELQFESTWFRGPAYLREHDSTWPPDYVDERATDDDCDRTEYKHPILMLQERSDLMDLPVPDCRRFSSWILLRRSAARVLQFINLCRKIKISSMVELEEKAEKLIFKQSQRETYSKEIHAISNGLKIHHKSQLVQLDPTLDEDGLLRLRGRVDAAKDVTYYQKRPIILDGKHPVARLIAKYEHKKCMHGSTETVVNEIRQRLWITKLRPTVRTVVSQCTRCRILRAMPRVPKMGNLPSDRLDHHTPPFTRCGVDLFGPLEITIGRRREKRYGVIFTCLTVRAIHIEIVSSLTTDSLIMALRRMASRRCLPRTIYSDNGTNMRGADQELRRALQELDRDALHDEASRRGVDWIFIPPSSPHMGGAWERLIRTVKTSLRAVLHERAPREEVLQTLFAEVEHLVNSRPLTFVSVDSRDPEAITPNHFLIGRSSCAPPPGQFVATDGASLRRQWRFSQILVEMCWRRWLKEYLPLLLRRTKWTQEQRPLCVGDVVVVAESNLPRGVWLKGLVQKTYTGADGRVRVADVKTKNGVLRRPVAKLAYLTSENEYFPY